MKIKLFKSPYSYYFYDGNKNGMVEVNEAVYDMLEKIQKKTVSISEYANDERIQKLMDAGYLCDEEKTILQHPMTDFLDTILSRNMEKVTIQLTQDCNFRCSYCPYTNGVGTQRKHEHKSISLDMAKRCIDFLKERCVDSMVVFVGFYGGEPLLEFNKLKEIVAYEEQVYDGRELVFTISTNGSLLTEEKIEYMIQHKINRLISIDGPEQINDKNRVFADKKTGTFQAVIKQIENFYRRWPEEFHKTSVNMVMDPSNDFDEINALFVQYPMFEECDFQSTLIDDSGTETPNQYSENFIKKYEYHYFLSLLNVLRNEKYPASIITQGHVKRMIDDLDREEETEFRGKYAVPSGPCIAGQSRALITVNGDILPCERVNENSEALRIGHIDTGFDLKKVSQLINISQLTSEDCQNCWAFQKCNMCAKGVEKDGELTASQRRNSCVNSLFGAEQQLRTKILIEECKGRRM